MRLKLPNDFPIKIIKRPTVTVGCKGKVMCLEKFETKTKYKIKIKYVIHIYYAGGLFKIFQHKFRIKILYKHHLYGLH